MTVTGAMTPSASFVSELILILLTCQLCLAHSVLGGPIQNDNLKSVDESVELTSFPALDDLELRNDIGELVSSLDYLEEHHSSRRRIKKVLPPQMSSIEEIEQNNPEIDDFRMKRFVGPGTQGKTLMKSFEYSKTSSGQPGKILRNISKHANNITGIELKFFQNGLLSSLKMSCPAVAEKHSIMLRTVEESAQNEIRSAFSNHRRSSVTLKMDELWAVVRKIKKCGKAFGEEQMSHKMETDEIPSKRGHGSRFDGIRKHFEEEAKRYALMSQLDVIPTSDNVAKVFELVQGQVMTNCFQDSIKKVAEDVGELLIKTIRMEKEKRFGKIPTLHQKEMENLLQDAKSCLLKL